jgi:N-acetylglutamate synthase-like GNAT family acetyltransferase
MSNLNVRTGAAADLVIEPLIDPKQLAALEADAKADGCVMVSRLIREWLDGRNRFSRVGEKAYVAKREERVCAVCGLNRDPFAGDERVGRVRRLYVAVQDRRTGVGTAVIERLMADARGVFKWVRLRTHDRAAAAFYVRIGFEPVAGDAECTHRRRVTA